MDRIRQLEEFLEEDPTDPFNSYALALEYLKTDPKKSQQLFEDLIKNKPEYLPTYYPYAQMLIDQQDARADVIFKQGIDIAKRLNDLKTFKELNSAYNDWLFDQS
jgi:hypothetical protein